MGSFSQSVSSNGWTISPNGVILQWGQSANLSLAGGVSGDVTATFPVEFPIACRRVVANCGSNVINVGQTWTSVSVTFFGKNVSTTSGNGAVSYMAVGN